jgi:cyclopropane fatty-acyl-phospholipid synthase-like methyltransferase
MSQYASERTTRIAKQYDLFQASLETVEKQRKYLNYGYTITGDESYELRQEQLCLEVFRAAELAKDHVVVDVGFGSGEQDFLLVDTCEFARLIGYNIAETQVRYASERAARVGLADKLEFRAGEAETLPGLAPASVDRVLAIECAFYFDRPRFYERAAEVLKPGGRLVLADICFSDACSWMARPRVGTFSGNRKEWEKFFRTHSIRPIHKHTRPGAQMTVTEIFKTMPRVQKLTVAQRMEWLKMAVASQIVALGLASRAFRYDLIVLER